MRYLAIAVTTAVVGALTVAAPTTAAADPFLCYTDWQCAKVTAIAPGSYLLLHNEPNYADGARPGSPHLHNGDILRLYCYTTGSGDADGHGDTYWWFVGDANSGVAGYANDYYLTTGTPSAFKKVVGQ